MTKTILKESHAVIDQVKKKLSDKYACFVLITCTAPSADGNMNVEMHYEGEESLAGFLVDNASQVFDEQISRRESR